MDEASKSLRISRLEINNFRCFQTFNIECNTPLILIQGANGAGKTSLLEALYYACYLRSFRTAAPRELITHGADNFFVRVSLDSASEQNEVQVGFSGARRLVKINQRPIISYKELLDFYRV